MSREKGSVDEKMFEVNLGEICGARIVVNALWKVDGVAGKRGDEGIGRNHLILLTNLHLE